MILVVGDSLSAEYGIKRNTGWVALLKERIASEKLHWQVVNASVSGETTQGGSTRLPALLTQHQPQVVVIALGANDGLRGQPIAAMKRNLRTMIEASQRAKARVVLIGMQIPPNYGRAYADEFAGAFAETAKALRLPFVPFLLDGIAQDTRLFQVDQIHPTEAAQPRLLDNVWPVVQTLLKTPAKR